MALLDVVETGQERVNELRTELDRARVALDRTDAVLAVADGTLERAEAAIVSSRRWGPVLAVALGVAVVGAVAFIVIRRRSQREAADGLDA
ncbi:MAG: hypothetical protein Q7V58_16680 [Actinomycetota bacterium]|nr:hypothetical protein [Actinomycetota bacterium]